jgi:hypothetical protein
MPHHATDRDDPALLRQTVEDLKIAYGQLFAFVEHSLEADPEAAASQALAFGGQIRQLMEEIDIRLGVLLERIEPWDERRALFALDLVAEVDRFLALLGPGLAALQEQLRHRVADIEHRMADIKKSLTRLGQQRQGVHGYKAGGGPSKRIDKKA